MARSAAELRVIAGQLQSIPILSKLSSEDCLALAGQVRHRWVKAGKPLFLQGEAGDALYLVAEGCLRVTAVSAAGQEVTVALRKQGSFLGEMALLDGGARSASVIAVTDCRLWVLARESFLSFLRGHPAVALDLLRALSIRLREASHKLHEVSHGSVRYRLAQLLADLAENEAQGILPALKHETLASLIGAKRESVTRAMRSFKEKGWIGQEGKRVRVIDAKGLRSLQSD